MERRHNSFRPPASLGRRNELAQSLPAKRAELVSAIASMTQTQQRVLALRYVEGLRVPQIAQVLGWTQVEVNQVLNKVTAAVEAVLKAKVRKRRAEPKESGK